MFIYKKNILYFSFFQVLVIGSASYLIGPIIPIISKELNIGLDIIGLAISLSIIAQFITTLLAGNFIEKFGYKIVYFIGIVFGIFGITGLYFFNSYIIFILAFILLQLGIGVIHVSTLSLVGNYYYKDKTNNLIKLALGNAIAFIISPLLVSIILIVNLNWRYIYIFFLIPQALLFGLLFFLKLPIAIKSDENIKSLFNVSKKVLSNPYFILCSIIILIYSAVKDTFFTWFTSYFTVFNIKVGISSLFLAGYGISTLAGMLIKNKVIKRFKEKKVLLFGIIISFISLIGIFFLDNLILKNILIFLFGVGFSGSFTITFSLGIEVNHKYTGSVGGILVASSFPGVIIFQYLSGYFSEHLSRNSVLIIDMILLFCLLISVLILDSKRFHIEKN